MQHPSNPPILKRNFNENFTKYQDRQLLSPVINYNSPKYDQDNKALIFIYPLLPWIDKNNNNDWHDCKTKY